VRTGCLTFGFEYVAVGKNLQEFNRIEDSRDILAAFVGESLAM